MRVSLLIVVTLIALSAACSTDATPLPSPSPGLEEQAELDQAIYDLWLEFARSSIENDAATACDPATWEALAEEGKAGLGSSRVLFGYAMRDACKEAGEFESEIPYSDYYPD